jgi:hypothetical protein
MTPKFKWLMTNKVWFSCPSQSSGSSASLLTLLYRQSSPHLWYCPYLRQRQRNSLANQYIVLVFKISLESDLSHLSNSIVSCLHPISWRGYSRHWMNRKHKHYCVLFSWVVFSYFSKYFSDFLFSFLSFFFDTGIWTQGLHLEPLHQPSFVIVYFWDRVLWTICLGWPWTAILVISASWVVSIISMSHWHPAFSVFDFWFF